MGGALPVHISMGFYAAVVYYYYCCEIICQNDTDEKTI
jgi:hypothetical protein